MGGRFGERVGEVGSGKSIQKMFCVKKSICESSLIGGVVRSEYSNIEHTHLIIGNV